MISYRLQSMTGNWKIVADLLYVLPAFSTAIYFGAKPEKWW
ncbi:MAG TPA: hypothetical protein VNR60_12515 [Croceibacterium sp.]|nr:hypothetical protein [Croceibacterium sp.]